MRSTTHTRPANAARPSDPRDRVALRRLLVAVPTLAILAATAPAFAAPVGYVYANNDGSTNTVSGFVVDSSGTLAAVPGSPFATGGNGSNGGFYAAPRIRATAGTTPRVYATNAAGNSVSVFDITAGGALTPVAGSPFATSVGRPEGLAIDASSSCLYVAGTDPALGIEAFAVGPTGALSSVATTPLTGELDDLELSPDGAYLVATFPNPDELRVYAVAPGCALSEVAGSPFDAGSPPDGITNVDFDASGSRLFCGVANGTGTEVDVFDFASGVPSHVAGSPFNFPAHGNNSNIALLAPTEDVLFVSNQNSASIAVMSVSGAGALTPIAGSPFAAPGAAFPARMDITPDGSLLMVAGGNGTGVFVYNVAAGGALTLVPGSPFPTGATGGLESLDFVSLGECGNGVLETPEECDEGASNGDPTSCCTASCTLVPAGTTCRADAGDCDVEETCDGALGSCPADDFEPAGTTCTDDGDACTDDECDGAGLCDHPDKPDTDADGTCDEQDVCTNAGGGQDFVASKPKPKVKLSRINTDPTVGDDQLRISAEHQLAVGATFSGLDPENDGARVVIENGADVARVDQVLPGGVYAGRGTRGWKRNGSGTTWTYTDTTSAPLAGIKRLKITDRSSTAPRRVKVTVKGQNGVYPVVTGDTPIEAIVVFGGQAAAIAGACGESAYLPGECTFNVSQSVLSCKK